MPCLSGEGAAPNTPNTLNKTSPTAPPPPPPTTNRQSDAQSSAAKLQEEREFLRSLNETLLANQKAYADKLRAAEGAAAARDAEVVDLQEQVGRNFSPLAFGLGTSHPRTSRHPL